MGLFQPVVFFEKNIITAPLGIQLDYLVLAGGGGGGTSPAGGGGGGGAGGLLSGSISLEESPTDPLVFSITVGGGGRPGKGSPSYQTPLNGSNSKFSGSLVDITSTGGGAGGHYGSDGDDGGSGGGGSIQDLTYGAAGSGIAGQGHDGAPTSETYRSQGGGGGGAYDAPANSNDYGLGITWLDGTSYARGGGSLGGNYNTPASGSGDGGGAGGNSIYFPPGSSQGAHGGSGVVKVRYPGSGSKAIGGTITYDAGDDVTYHSFTTAGTDSFVWYGDNWTPDAFENVQYYWRADSGITTDVDGVTSWVDRINSYELISPSGSNRPASTTNADLNGQDVVSFDGTSDFLIARDEPTYLSGSDITWLWVAQTKDYPAGDGTIFGYTLVASTGGRSWFDGLNDTIRHFNAFPNNNFATNYFGAPQPSGSIVGYFNYDSSAGSTEVWVNDTSSSVVNTGGTTGTDYATTGIYSMGATITSRTNQTAFNGRYIEVDIAEAVVIHGTPSNGEMKRWKEYVNTKYGTIIDVPFDSDAQTFITAASITDDRQQYAVNYLTTELKKAGIWSKIDALYPIIGGNAAAHSYNLKDTGSYQITWNGTITHNAAGAKGDGTTGWGNTNLNFATQLNGGDAENGNHLFYYITDVIADGGLDIGVDTTAGDAWHINSRNGSNVFNTRNINGTLDSTSGVTATEGAFGMSRTSSTSYFKFQDKTQQVIARTAGTKSDQTIGIMAQHGNTSAGQFQNRVFALVSMGGALSQAEADTFVDINMNYQRILDRLT